MNASQKRTNRRRVIGKTLPVTRYRSLRNLSNNRLFTQKEFTHQLITGDFNAKEICWETWSTSSSDKIGQELQECPGYASMTPKVYYHTQVRECQNPSLIYLVLVNEDDYGTECSHWTVSWVERPCRRRI